MYLRLGRFSFFISRAVSWFRVRHADNTPAATLELLS